MLVVLLIFCNSAWADARKAIGTAYARSSKAMSAKFVPGVYSIRAPRFELFDAEGTKVDVEIEERNLLGLLNNALRVRETSKIVSLTESGERAHCLVEFRTNLRMLEPGKKQAVDYELRSLCADEWVQIGSEWKLERSQVKKQEMVRR